MSREKILTEAFEKIGISITEKQQGQLIRYYDMIIEKNKVMNLTTIIDYDEAVNKHFIDSVMLGKKIELNKKMKVIDIGTGAGFPGIPLKIIYPEMEIVLLDSLNKRILFLQEVIDNLELKEIEVIHARAEEPAKWKDYREKFDICVSRAVANLAVLSEYCIPYVKLGGYFIAYKTGRAKEEIEASVAAISRLGGQIEEIISFELSGAEVERNFVKILKKGTTPKIYPRSAGKPSKEPLQ